MVSFKIIEKPKRKIIIKRGFKAANYLEYVDEVGKDIWNTLSSIGSLLDEPIYMWLPRKYIKKNTSEFVMGIEVSNDYSENILEGFDIIELPYTKYLVFTGEPIINGKNDDSIKIVKDYIANFDPKEIGHEWDYSNPKIALEPIESRGYIELLPIK